MKNNEKNTIFMDIMRINWMIYPVILDHKIQV